MWVLNNLNIKYAKISKCRGHAFMQYKIPLLIQIFLPMHLYNSSYVNSKNYQLPILYDLQWYTKY